MTDETPKDVMEAAYDIVAASDGGVSPFRIADAIMAERERCAKIVEGWHKDNLDHSLTFQGGKLRLTAVVEITQAMRDGAKP